MSNAVYYIQECPTCGRNLRIRVVYLGHRVTCQHCHGRFVASDPLSGEPPPPDSGIGLLRRADHLLELASQNAGRLTAEPPSLCDPPPAVDDDMGS
jgi:hypothetical protein